MKACQSTSLAFGLLIGSALLGCGSGARARKSEPAPDSTASTAGAPSTETAPVDQPTAPDPGNEGARPGTDVGSTPETGGLEPSANAAAAAADGTDEGRPPGPGPAEVCDGVDNDGNGVIDDVDTGNDGICDCLKIATLGRAGTWGQGDVFATWLATRSNDGSVGLGDQVITQELLAPFEIVIIEDVSWRASYGAAEIAALQAWVAQGGGLLALTGYGEPTEVQNVNSLLAPFGMAFGADQVMKKAGPSTVPVTTWGAMPIADKVSAVGMDNGHPVLGSGVDVATGEGVTLSKAETVQAGRVLTWGDEWITYSSEWTQHPEYQVDNLWVNIVKWLSPPRDCRLVALP